MKYHFDKYKVSCIESQKPKLSVSEKELANHVCESIIDRILNIVSGSLGEELFTPTENNSKKA